MKPVYLGFAYFVVATRLFSQQTNVGDIIGTVQDGSGAIVPAAEVVVVNSATGVTHSTLTTSSGVYSIKFLQVGSYQITASKPGFRMAVSREVHVIAGQTTTTDF